MQMYPGWRHRLNRRADLVTFFKFCRDDLHALPPALRTAAEMVPIPRMPSDEKPAPVVVLAFLDIWRILINVQDLETVFFFALAVFAGLHQSEILKLDWGDIKWDGRRGIEILIPPNVGKNRGKKPEGRYAEVQRPLDQILRLGKGRTGKIVSNTKTMKNKISRLAKRLGIKWQPSIMRHTFASFLLGKGKTEEEVAKLIGDLVSTLRRHYIRPMSKQESRVYASLPVKTEIFEDLDDRLREWDWEGPLKELRPQRDRGPGKPEWRIVTPRSSVPGAGSKPLLASNGKDSRSEHKTEHNQPPLAVSTQSEYSGHVEPRRRADQLYWPPYDQFVVLVWEITQKHIALKLGCSQEAVSLHIRKLKIERPPSEYWRKLRKGEEVEVPEFVKQARQRVAESQSREALQATATCEVST